MIEWLVTNLDLVLTILAGLTTVLTIIFGSGRKLKNTSTIISVWQKLPELIDTAEKIAGLTGEQRKAYVIEQVKLSFSSLGVTLKESELELTSQLINELVALTKSINLHSKKEEKGVIDL